MRPFRDFEAEKARDWDVTSQISDALDEDAPPAVHDASKFAPIGLAQQTFVQPTEQRRSLNNGPAPTLTQQLRNPTQATGQTPRLQAHNIADNGTPANGLPAFDGGSYRGSRSNQRNTSPYDHNSAPQRTGRSFTGTADNGGRNGSRARSHHQSQSTMGDRSSTNAPKWAGPAQLITTRQAGDIANKEAKKKKWEKLLKPAPADDYFPSVGYYLWPIADESAQDLLGSRLEKLDPIRKTLSVHIEWHPATRCLIVSPRVRPDQTAVSDQTVVSVIESIRRAVHGADAVRIALNPTFIIVPPTASAMRSIVRPRTLRRNPTEAEYMELAGIERPILDSQVKQEALAVARDLELSGSEIPKKDCSEWKKNRPDMVTNNRELFKSTLIKGLTSLEPMKGWMRMRVYFGHIFLTKFQPSLGQSTMSFEKFNLMMNNSRQEGGFNKMMRDAAIAMELRKTIVAQPQRFLPVGAKTMSLDNIKFKDTEVLFVSTRLGQNFRIEAEIDHLYENQVGEYQAGSTQMFTDKVRDDKVKITTVDVERGIDWLLEVTTGSQLESTPREVLSLIADSVSPRTKVGKDALGLDYPIVAPRSTTELTVNRINVKSAIEYKMKSSGCVIEIAIYREWTGEKIVGEPTTKASVSLYHPGWDDEMESIEHTTRVRNFGPGLINLFNTSYETKGIPNFLAEVETIQGFLVDATRKFLGLPSAPPPPPPRQ